MGYPDDVQEWCSIARALDVVGDKWTLLIVREAAKGSTRFSEIQEGLGIAKDVLGARLALLVDTGILSKQPYRDPTARTRDEYVLSERGHGLLTVLGALSDWGTAHRPAANPPYLNYVDATTGEGVSVQFVTATGRTVPTDNVRVVPAQQLTPA
jgi:DNA-binding HxlR family transcriptional regulator